MPRPRLSVTIPVHNGASYLPMTLKSVLAQAPGPDDMQIVVVDDCSKDDPAAVVRECAGDRIEFVRSDTPLGPARAFNRAVEAATGELVHLLHADDLVMPGFYDRVRQVFDTDPGIGMFVCRAYEINSHGRRTGVLSIPPLMRSHRIEYFYHLLVPVNWVRTPGVVVPRSAYDAIGVYDDRLNHTQDWNMWLRLATHYPTWYEDDILTEYRVHAASDTTRKVNNGKYLAEFYLAIRYWLDANPDLKRRDYLHKITHHVRKLAMDDLWQVQLAEERIEVIGNVFNEHLPELRSAHADDLAWALREMKRIKRTNAIRGAL